MHFIVFIIVFLFTERIHFVLASFRITHDAENCYAILAQEFKHLSLNSLRLGANPNDESP